MIEVELRSVLIADVDVAALVDDRVYALEAEDLDGQAYIVYSLIHGDRGATLVGSSNCRQARIEINCYSPDYGEVKRLADLVQLAIEDSFDAVFNGDRDFNEKETNLRRVMLDYSLWEND